MFIIIIYIFKLKSLKKVLKDFKVLNVFNKRWKYLIMNFIIKLLKSKNLNENSITNIIIIINKLLKQIHHEFINEIIILNIVEVFYHLI